jgi:hypothetical protein
MRTPRATTDAKKSVCCLCNWVVRDAVLPFTFIVHVNRCQQFPLRSFKCALGRLKTARLAASLYRNNGTCQVAALVRALDPDGNGAVGRLELSGGLAKLGLPLGGAEANELFDALNGLVPLARTILFEPGLQCATKNASQLATARVSISVSNGERESKENGFK